MTLEDLALYAKTFGTVVCFLALCLLAAWSPRIRRRWLRWCLRITGVVALVPGFLSLVVLLWIPKYTSVSRLPSPDGRFICYVKGGGSAATDDWTSITLRRAWRPIAREVYFTEGSFDPQVRWKGPETLLILYPEHEDPTLCRQFFAGVNVECQSAPRKEFYPLESRQQDQATPVPRDNP